MANLLDRGELSRIWNGLPVSEVVRKMIEIYSVSIASAALFTSVFIIGIIPQTYPGCVFCTIVSLLLNIVWVTYRIRRTILSGTTPFECRALFFKAYAPFAVVNMILAFFELEPVYTWLFLPYKVFGFGLLPRVVSAFIINVVMFIVYYFMPDIPVWVRASKRKRARKAKLGMRRIRKVGNRAVRSRSSMHRRIKFK